MYNKTIIPKRQKSRWQPSHHPHHHRAARGEHRAAAAPDCYPYRRLHSMTVASALSIKELKAELASRRINTTGCSEKSELIALLEQAQSNDPPQAKSNDPPMNPPSEPSSSMTPQATKATPESDADMDTNLARLSNLLDTLPGSLQLLDRKWSEARQDKIRGQLRSVKELLDATSSEGAGLSSWQTRLTEYNELARDFKRIRDLPRNMSG